MAGRRIETIAVHAGRSIDPATGAVAPPIHLSTTFEREPDGSYPRGFAYTTFNNPNRAWLEQAITELEGGAAAVRPHPGGPRLRACWVRSSRESGSSSPM